MLLTLNQVVKRLQVLALAHKQINDFKIGDMVEWLNNGDVTYPAVFIDFNSGDLSRDNKLLGWNFEIWFCDLADVAINTRANEIEVESDLTSIAADYKAMLDYSEYSATWEIGESSPLEYFKEKFEDIVIAVKMSVRIDVRYDENRCDIPSTMTFERLNYDALATEDSDLINTEGGQNIPV